MHARVHTNFKDLSVVPDHIPTRELMRRTRTAVIVLIVAVTGALTLGLSGVGYQQELWTLRTAFAMVKWTAYLGIATGLVALAGLIMTRRQRTAMPAYVAALVLCTVTAGLPWSWQRKARSVPPIHDITTDTQDPPAFVAVLPLRTKAKNPVEYGGDSVAALQRAGYPDVIPVPLSVTPAVAFAKVRAAATTMQWELVAADSAAGRLEATATTRWFGFKDDVVVRVRAEGTGSRIDVRSLSRIGGSDVGTNAERIRAFVALLRA